MGICCFLKRFAEEEKKSLILESEKILQERNLYVNQSARKLDHVVGMTKSIDNNSEQELHLGANKGREGIEDLHRKSQ